MSSSSVFPFRFARPHADVRLFCFPFAGGSAVLYREWGALLPATVEVWPVELPGRGTRFGEQPARSVADVCDVLAPAIGPLVDRPVAFFGHSMGARIAFEMTKRFAGRTRQLFVSAAPAPDVHDNPPIAMLPDDAFKRELAKLGGTPPEILADRELMDLFLPILRADFRVVETYLAAADVKVPCPITSFAGTRDERVKPASVRRWMEFTSEASRHVDVDGDHFFLDPKAKRAELLAEIARDLERAPS